MKNLFLIGIGGALGALSRYGVMVTVLRILGGSYPFATLSVNLSGSFLAGILFQFIQVKFSGYNQLYLFLSIGFLGAFTTFSAFSVESIAMIERKAWISSFLYCFFSVVLSLLVTFLGMRLAKAFLS